MPPIGEFTQIHRNGDGSLYVEGTYNPGAMSKDDIYGNVVVPFLIIQQDGNDNPTIVVDGVALWEPSDPINGAYPPFAGTVKACDAIAALDPDKGVRAIGAAIQIYKYDAKPQVPPGVAVFTWCVQGHLS